MYSMNEHMESYKVERLIQERFQIEQWINTALIYQHKLELDYDEDDNFLEPSKSYIRKLEMRLDRLDSTLESLGVL